MTSLQPKGRLIILTDTAPNPATMTILEHICTVWPIPAGRVCVVTGFSSSAVLKVTNTWRHLFFDPMNFNPLEVAVGLLPWAEVWIVGDGHVWSMGTSTPPPTLCAA